MKVVTKGVLSVLVSGMATAVGLRWPRSERAGWFELDGRPVAVDGAVVRDWQHVNELLAHSASVTWFERYRRRNAASTGSGAATEPVDREFTLAYVPIEGHGSVRHLVVRQRLPVGGGPIPQHPVAYASYEIVGAEGPGLAR